MALNSAVLLDGFDAVGTRLVLDALGQEFFDILDLFGALLVLFELEGRHVGRQGVLVLLLLLKTEAAAVVGLLPVRAELARLLRVGEGLGDLLEVVEGAAPVAAEVERGRGRGRGRGV